MTQRRSGGSFAALIVSLFASTASLAADPPLDEVHTLSTGSEPAEHSFSITTAGAYHVKLTDVNTGQTNANALNQPMTSAKLALTTGATVLVATSITPTENESDVAFNAQPGTVVMRVVGKTAAGKTGGVNVVVTRDSDGSVVNQFAPAFAPPPNAIPDYRVFVEETFVPAATGNYAVELEDLAFPVVLPQLKGLVVRTGGAPVAVLDVPAGQVTGSFAATAGDSYTVGVVASADQAVNAGLIGLRIRDTATGAVVFTRTITVGRVSLAGSVTLAAGAHTLTLTDFQFPNALAESGALVALNGSVAARTNAPGAVDFTASAGNHQIYALAAASGTNPGTYGVDLRAQGGSSLFFTAKGVGGAYNFVADVTAAGAYRVRIADFSFPGPLSKLNLFASQNGVRLDSLTAAGSLNLPNVAAGQLFLVAVATPAASSGGLFGIDVAPTAGGATLFEATQGVGNLSASRKVSVTTPGKYRVNVTDLKFPAAFQEFSAIVTRGADTSVAIFGSDRFDFDATTGNYSVNFVARPDATEGAGTYGLRMALAPAAPTVSFTSSPTDASVGGTVTLQWAATNATSCTASGAWSGSKAVSGSETSQAITATTTFNIRCDGEGGSTTKTLTVNAVSQANDDKGGGGALGWLTLAGLALAGATRRRGRAFAAV